MVVVGWLLLVVGGCWLLVAGCELFIYLEISWSSFSLILKFARNFLVFIFPYPDICSKYLDLQQPEIYNSRNWVWASLGFGFWESLGFADVNVDASLSRRFEAAASKAAL